MKKVSIVILAIVFIAGFVIPVFAEGSWEQEVAAGYTSKTGNTQNSQLNLAYQGKKTMDESELDLKAATLYSSQNKKMDGQKSNGMARYAPNLGDSDWFTFAKVEAEHDKFASIDHRIMPSLGTGYWFAKEEEWKAMAEVGIGYETVKYTDSTTEENMVLSPRFYCEKMLFDRTKLTQDLVYYPSLERADNYRVRSETVLTNALSEEVALRVSFIDEFNSTPIGDIKKNDTQLVFSLVYSF
ncbi:MAG: DUF481 domain-containing protein [Candidatus Omnitrophica bacterium]|nr:DUF481 domain-containing protein [Candidatus Omnitrophota bacterium]